MDWLEKTLPQSGQACGCSDGHAARCGRLMAGRRCAVRSLAAGWSLPLPGDRVSATLRRTYPVGSLVLLSGGDGARAGAGAGRCELDMGSACSGSGGAPASRADVNHPGGVRLFSVRLNVDLGGKRDQPKGAAGPLTGMKKGSSGMNGASPAPGALDAGSPGNMGIGNRPLSAMTGCGSRTAAGGGAYTRGGGSGLAAGTGASRLGRGGCGLDRAPSSSSACGGGLAMGSECATTVRASGSVPGVNCARAGAPAGGRRGGQSR